MNGFRWRRIALSAGLAGLLVAVPASAWVFEFPLEAKVNGHEFDKIKVEGKDCKLTVKLWFDAPKDGYDSRAKNRNHHRFKARVEFGEDRVLETVVFGNGTPGKRLLRHEEDTSGAGCWSKEKLKVRDVDVVGCRAKGCKLPAFED